MNATALYPRERRSAATTGPMFGSAPATRSPQRREPASSRRVVLAGLLAGLIVGLFACAAPRTVIAQVPGSDDPVRASFERMLAPAPAADRSTPVTTEDCRSTPPAGRCPPSGATASPQPRSVVSRDEDPLRRSFHRMLGYAPAEIASSAPLAGDTRPADGFDSLRHGFERMFAHQPAPFVPPVPAGTDPLVAAWIEPQREALSNLAARPRPAGEEVFVQREIRKAPRL